MTSRPSKQQSIAFTRSTPNQSHGRSHPRWILLFRPLPDGNNRLALGDPLSRAQAGKSGGIATGRTVDATLVHWQQTEHASSLKSPPTFGSFPRMGPAPESITGTPCWRFPAPEQANSFHFLPWREPASIPFGAKPVEDNQRARPANCCSMGFDDPK